MSDDQHMQGYFGLEQTDYSHRGTADYNTGRWNAEVERKRAPSTSMFGYVPPGNDSSISLVMGPASPARDNRPRWDDADLFLSPEARAAEAKENSFLKWLVVALICLFFAVKLFVAVATTGFFDRPPAGPSKQLKKTDAVPTPVQQQPARPQGMKNRPAGANRRGGSGNGKSTAT